MQLYSCKAVIQSNSLLSVPALSCIPFFCHLRTLSFLLQPYLFTSQGSNLWAKSARKDMLLRAETCFQQALGLEGTKHAEPWIYSLMLGKISHKLGRPVAKSLQHLLTVCLLLPVGNKGTGSV